MAQDPDQRAYMVQSNLGSFHVFNRTYGKILDKFEEDIAILSCNVVDYFDNSKQKEEEFERKRDLCTTLKRVISKYNPDWSFNIVATGSSVTGLATENSDLDVAIHIPQAAFIIEEKCADQIVSEEQKKVIEREMQLDILQIVRLVLEKDEETNALLDWKHDIKLVQAQIQILQIKTVDGIECDISVVMDCFLSSMHNSFLIKHLTMSDYRFGPLCALVKQWAARTKVKNPKDGGFNSYALVLLVIHYLQCGTSPPILPNLMHLYKDDQFIAMSDRVYPACLDFSAPLPRRLPRIGENRAPVFRLFLEFLHYYSDFDFKESFISINNAMIKNRRLSGKDAVQDAHRKQVYIEDPFDAHNPGRTVRTLKKIQETMRDTLKMFNPDACADQKFEFPTLENILNMDVSESASTIAESGGEDSEDETGVPREDEVINQAVVEE